MSNTRLALALALAAFPLTAIQSGPALAAGALDSCFEPATQDPPFLTTTHEPHELRVIDEGLADLALRLKMIEHAQDSIDYEVYLFKRDFVGRSLLAALADRKAANPKLKIRVLIDGFGDSFKLYFSAYDMAVLTDLGIEVRYYNPGVHSPSFLPFGRHNHHNHSKLFVVDQSELMVGGRNAADAYFGLDDTYDYQDRDYWVHGRLAQTAHQAFDAYWNDSSWVSEPRTARKDAAKYQAALAFMRPNSAVAEDAAFLQTQAQALTKGAALLEPVPTFEVHALTLVQDKPGHKAADRMVTPYVHAELAKVTQALTLEHYNVAMSKAKEDLVLGAIARDVELRILTNGYPSTDGPDVTQFSRKTELELVRAGAKYGRVLAKDTTGKPEFPDNLLDAAKAKAVWGLHTKTAVARSPAGSCETGAVAMIGSYNYDTRSQSLNNEILLGVHDEQVAQFVEASIARRLENAHQVLPDGTYLDGADAKPNLTLKQKLFDWITGPMATGTFPRR